MGQYDHTSTLFTENLFELVFNSPAVFVILYSSTDIGVITLDIELELPYDNLLPEQKKQLLFEKQRELLDTFLNHNAITKEQYNKSLGDLIVKMGMEKI